MAPVVLHHWSVALLPEQHSAVPLVAGRSIHAYWLFLSPHFRTVLLPPQRRVAEATAAWSWHHHGPLAPPTPPELTQLRASLREALRSLKDAADTPLRSSEPDQLQRQALLLELSVRMQEVVERLLQLSDANLGGFVCRTDDGLRVHSWGALRADRPHSPEEFGPAAGETRRRRSPTWFTWRKTVLAWLVVAAGITGAWWWRRDDSGAAARPPPSAGIEERAPARPEASHRSSTDDSPTGESRAAAAGPPNSGGSLNGAAPARTTGPVGRREDVAEPVFAPTEAFASRESAPAVSRSAGMGLAPGAAGAGGPGAGGAPINAASGGGMGGGSASTSAGAPSAGAQGGLAGDASAATAPGGGAASSDGEGGPGGAASAVRAPAPPDAAPSQRSPAEQPKDEPSPAERDPQPLEDPAVPGRTGSPQETPPESPAAPDPDGNVAPSTPPASSASSAPPSPSPSSTTTTTPAPASPSAPAPAAAAAAPPGAVSDAEQQAESTSLATDPSSASAANPPLLQTLSLAVPQWRLVPRRNGILPTFPEPAEAPDQVEPLRRATLEQWREALPSAVREIRPRLGFTLRFPKLAAKPAAWVSRSGTAPPTFHWDATQGAAEILWSDHLAAAGEAELRDDAGQWLARVRWEPDGRLTLSTWRTTDLEAWVEVPAAAATVLPRLQAFLLPKEGGTPIRAVNPATTPSHRYRWPARTWIAGAASLLADDSGSWALHASLDAQFH